MPRVSVNCLHLLHSLSNQGHFGLQMSELVTSVTYKPNLLKSGKSPSRSSRLLGLLLFTSDRSFVGHQGVHIESHDG